MRIVRIADNAINIYISERDLAIRNLVADTLKEGSHDFDQLVWDAIDHANIEFGHEFEDCQLNIVNKYDGNGGLVLTISHDKDPGSEGKEYITDPNNDLNKKIDKIFISAAKRKNKNSIVSEEYKDDDEYDDYDDYGTDDIIVESFNNLKASMNDRNMQNMSSILDMSPEEFREFFRRIYMQSQNQSQSQIQNQNQNQNQDSQPPKQQAQSANRPENQFGQKTISPIRFPHPPRRSSAVSDWDVLIFPEMNDMLEFFARNKSFKTIASSLYTYRGAYYLVLKPNRNNLSALNRLESLAIDYNATYLPAESFLPLLKERGTVIMEAGAISKLINNFGL